MIIRQFLLWARTAPPGQRAEAVGALARAYLYSELSPDDRWEAETAMTALLDDPSPLVRRALAEAFANAPEAPRHLVVALANDQSDAAFPARHRLATSSEIGPLRPSVRNRPCSAGPSLRAKATGWSGAKAGAALAAACVPWLAARRA